MATFARLVTTDGVTHALDVTTAENAGELLSRFTGAVFAAWEAAGDRFQIVPDEDVNKAPLLHGATVLDGVFTNP